MKLHVFFFFLLVSDLAFAQTWIRQNPFPKLAQLKDVDFDGEYGLAVGSEGTIFTTTNGGENWISRKTSLSATDLYTALVVPGTSGQKMLAGGKNLTYSDDGGETWFTTYTMPGIFKIQSLPGGVLLALGSDFGIYSVNNGGLWHPFLYPGQGVAAGHFTSMQTGWIQYGSFNNNQVWVTTDGGAHWDLRDETKYTLITDIEMISDETGFMSTIDEVYKTIDGGWHWNGLGANPITSITDMHVVNEAAIWTCLNNGFVYYTVSGGGNWYEIDPGVINSNQTLGIWANNTGEAWVAGKYVSIEYTDNYGQDWTDQIPNAKATLFRPHFFDEFLGFAAGSEGTLLKTTDGGAIWQQINHFVAGDNFRAVQVIDDQAILAGSSTGRVYLSLDQGLSWDTIGSNLGQITDIVAANRTTFILTTEDGKIYGTVNAGQQWIKVFDQPLGHLFSLDFVNVQEGWAAGYDGMILHTTNAGLSWLPQYQDGHTQFSDIQFTSPTDGWAVASNLTDSLWMTTDGGANWSKAKLPIATYWRGISFTSPDTGWIAGGGAGYGIILRTNDGGQSWTTDHESPEALMGLYAVPSKETAWAVGFGGNIVKYSPCNFLPVISDLSGSSTVCAKDTVTYEVTSSDVDIFEWSFPSDWIVYGNSNTASIQFIVGDNPGVVSVKGKDACGEETQTLSQAVTVEAVPEVEISESNGILTCHFTGVAYQWLINGSPINGADQSTYTALESGTYTCIVIAFGTGCEIRSNSLFVTISAIAETPRTALMLFPNPAGTVLYWREEGATGLKEEAIITLYRLDGSKALHTVGSNHQIDLSGLAPGMYMLSFTQGSLNRSAVVVKL